MQFTQILGTTYVTVADDVARMLNLADQSLAASEKAMTGDPAGLRSIAVSYRKLAEQTGTTSQELAGRPRTLQARNDWRGAACDSYQQNTTRLVTAVDAITGSLTKQATALTDAATGLESARVDLLAIRNSFQTASWDLRERAARWGTPAESDQLIARTREVCSQATSGAAAVQSRLEQTLTTAADVLTAAGP